MNTISSYQAFSNPEITRKQLKAGLWLEGGFEWYQDEDASIHSGGAIRTITQSFTKNQISFVTCTIKNTSMMNKFPKMVYHYENVLDRQTVAFYSPGEQAILHVGDRSMALLGGVVKGKGISQYCIQGKGSLYQDGCFKSLREGILSYSPLAKGEVTSIFSLEAEIAPQECIEAIAWVIHSDRKEEAIFLHENLLNEIPNREF